MNDITISQLQVLHNELITIIKSAGNIERVSDLLTEKDRLFPAPAISDMKKIGYFTQRKIDENSVDSLFDIENRKKYGLMVKPGKFFKHLFPEKNAAEIQNLVSEYYSIINIETENKTFEVWSDIKKAYHESNYLNNSGTLGNSCMKYNQCQQYLEFYENYNVKVLVLLENGCVTGRALLWKNVYFEYTQDEKTFMDRVYTNDYNDEKLFIDYAKTNGFVYKLEQSLSNKSGFIYDNESFYNNIKIDPETPTVPVYAPYLDTLTYCNEEFVLSNESIKDFSIALESTSGEIEQDGEICEDCGERFNEDEGIYVEDHGCICESCRDNYSWCEFCQKYAYYENGVYLNDVFYCEGCAGDELSSCEDCGELHLNEDLIETEDGYVCEDCIDNYIKCEHCEEYFSLKNTTTIDGESYCDNCRDRYYTQCEDCVEWVSDNDIKYHDGNNYCPDCYDEIIENEDEEELA